MLPRRRLFASRSISMELGGCRMHVISGTIETSDLYHPLDPRTLLPDNHEHRIYADDVENLWVVVDGEDYAYFSRWRWEPCYDKRGKKLYLRRKPGPVSGHARRWLWLHVEILRRSRGEPPGPAYHIGDHLDGDTVNCRRANLRWATFSMNRRNRHGCALATRLGLVHDHTGGI
jgi:hypothetical protein